MTRTNKQNIFNRNSPPPRKNIRGSFQPVGFCFVCGSPKYLFLLPPSPSRKKNTASVHSGPFQRIHAPQRRRRVTVKLKWRWIFRFCWWIRMLWFLFGKAGCVQHMDGFFLKSAQQKNIHPLGIQGIVPGKLIRMLRISLGIGTLYPRYPKV